MRNFNSQEDQFLKDNYLAIPATQMAKMLNRSKGTARQRMALLGIIVPPEVIERFKLESRFKKGDIPKNKGKNQHEYMSKEGIERTIATRFSKGNLPHNTKFDECISVRPDNRGVQYNFIRISLGKWIPLHRYRWEQHNGKIEKGMKLAFRDGNTLNSDIDNLELLTSAELMKRNSLHNYPEPIAQTIRLRGVLNRKINKRLKQITDEKQSQ